MSERELLLKLKVDEVYPKLSIEKINEFLLDEDKDLQKMMRTNTTVESLPKEIDNLIKSVYISHSLNSIAAIKARFLQFFEISEFFADYEILKKNVKFGSVKIDLILKHKSQNQIRWVFFFENLDRLYFTRLQTSLNAFQKKEEIYPIEILFVCGKLERLVGLEKKSIRLDKNEVQISFLVEFVDPARPFDDIDLILVDDLKIYGFNFGSIEDVIDYLRKVKEPGQYSIKIETPHNEVKTIWEGILFPQQILKKR